MPKASFGTFSLEAPAGWTLSSVILMGPVENPPGGSGTADLPKPARRNLIVTMERVGESDTAEGYLRRRLGGEEGGAGPRLSGVESLSLAGGREAKLVEQVVLSPDGDRVRQLQMVFIKDGIAHTATASHADGVAFEGVRAEFRQLLLSFA